MYEYGFLDTTNANASDGGNAGLVGNTTSTPPDSADQSVYEKIRGSVLLDGIIQAFLLGFVLAQALKYRKDYQDDSWRKRLFVGVVAVLSLLQTMIEEFKVWTVTIDFKPWSKSAFAWTDILVNGCICWMCEVFFIRRCWKMTESGIINPKASHGRPFPFRAPSRPSDTGTTSNRGSYHLTRLDEEIAPPERPIRRTSGIAPLSPEVVFSSPRMDFSERGYSTRRVTSIAAGRIGH
ncbi:hypothetical protein D9758_004819 [Tetrapyrgos nigripes]|uniref:Uncharacterized protein n=1 Tax=Tetrapyrgos nigripes TaxID=182062 RepID=A0A8H5G654_9AGAR|nr:hypothetical protein D9758_004819 [Tetrapyrgos nigripes]